MYYLYFIENGKYKFYGNGNMTYIMEPLNDYLNTCRMYAKESIEFKVSSKML